MQASGNSQARWTLADGGVYETDPKGRHLLVPAARVWNAVFTAKAPLGDKAAAESLLESGVEFARVPASPLIVIKGAFQDGLRVEIEAVSDGVRASLHPSVSDQMTAGGKWIPLDVELFEEARVLLSAVGVHDGMATLGQAIRLKSAKGALIPVVDESLPANAAFSALNVRTETPGLVANLYGYQEQGISFLRFIASEGLGCVLGDEMGLGKTLQVIGLLQAERNAGRVPALVVAPATLIENWRRELAGFAPALHVCVHMGSARAGAADRLAEFDVVVTSFETAVRDEPLLSSVHWNVLVLDEAQNIKNPDAQRTRVLKDIPRRVSIAVTGTPVENSLSDLWSLSDFALPGLLGQKADFLSEFDDTKEDASRLADVVAPIMLRRRVAEVASDLPPRIDIPQPLVMTESMAAGYESLRREIIGAHPKGAALIALQSLRMYCSHPLLKGSWQRDPADQMPKYMRLLEILDEVFAGGEKCLIFSTYNDMSEMLVQDLGKRFRSVPVKAINGSVPVILRQPIVDEFTSHRGPAILVLNPKAAGTGLNITAANHVVHYNPEWNPAVQDQATARSYRRRQTLPVTVHYLYFVSTVEEIMMDRLEVKRELAATAAPASGDKNTRDILRALQISPVAHGGNA